MSPEVFKTILLIGGIIILGLIVLAIYLGRVMKKYEGNEVGKNGKR